MEICILAAMPEERPGMVFIGNAWHTAEAVQADAAEAMAKFDRVTDRKRRDWIREHGTLARYPSKKPRFLPWLPVRAGQDSEIA